jgi:hypothetical protein
VFRGKAPILFADGAKAAAAGIRLQNFHFGVRRTHRRRCCSQDVTLHTSQVVDDGLP